MLISAELLKPSQDAGALIVAHSLIQAKRTKMTRSSFRKTDKEMQASFADLGEPEARLECISAQPHVLQPLMKEPNATLDKTVKEHAVLRAYSGCHRLLTELQYNFFHDSKLTSRGTLSGIENLTYLQYASFLLWSDDVLHELWANELGQHLDDHLPAYIEATLGLILKQDDLSMDAEMASPNPDISTSL
ncbi:hypothetical protein PsorP6_001183 [Peronosclerospora sorghi]|uniref:Uncharacterized protein n=1 Tax=Peronosclerospora sorghi TaxID=230839 RepID=A0ACC0WSC4_9STRA|nr:hypothetical protein PsorP6_001183 [Peronosclerospora sorghi]